MTSEQDDTKHLRMGVGGPRDEHTVDALASGAEEGRDQATKRLGEPRVGDEPRVSEWGNPIRVIPDHPRLNP